MCVCVCIPADMVHGTLRLALSTDNRLSMRLGNQQQQHQWLQQHKKGLNRKGQARTIKTKQQQNNNDKPEKKSPEREKKNLLRYRFPASDLGRNDKDEFNDDEETDQTRYN